MLVQQLGDISPKVRETAESTLATMGPVALPALEDALINKDVEIVFRAERLLLETESARCRESQDVGSIPATEERMMRDQTGLGDRVLRIHRLELRALSSSSRILQSKLPISMRSHMREILTIWQRSRTTRATDSCMAISPTGRW